MVILALSSLVIIGPFVQSPANAYVGVVDEPFGGVVNSGGWDSNFTTQRYSPDPYQRGVYIQIYSFTSSDGRRMFFGPNNCYDFNLQPGYVMSTNYAGGPTAEMIKTRQCWRFRARVDPGRDTNGSWSAGFGNTTFNGNVDY